jgi:hypothetical protein
MKRYVVTSIGQFLAVGPPIAWVNHVGDATKFDALADAETAARASLEEDASIRELPDGADPVLLRIAVALELIARRLDGFASEDGASVGVHVCGAFDSDEADRRRNR